MEDDRVEGGGGGGTGGAQQGLCLCYNGPSAMSTH